MNGAFIAALARFGKSIVETGILFAAAAVLAVVAQQDITAREIAAVAAFAFVKGTIEAAGRYLAALRPA